MLRALCLGILAISAVAACKGKGDTSAVAADSAAGKVVAVSGSVEATRGGATRQLAVGADVFADDEIKTGADGTVEIELFHNHAKWSLIANKQARVDASLAWGMAKQEASKAVEHNTAAAGREAERSAAETAATAAEERKQDMKEAPKPEAMPVPTTAAAPGAGAGEATGGAPPPPPPPPPAKPMAADEEEEKQSRDDVTTAAPRQIAQGGKTADKGAPMIERAEAKVVISPQIVADKHKPQFTKCFDANTRATITIDVSANKTSTSIDGVKNVSSKQRTCVANVAKAIVWPVKGSTFQVKVKLDEPR